MDSKQNDNNTVNINETSYFIPDIRKLVQNRKSKSILKRDTSNNPQSKRVSIGGSNTGMIFLDKQPDIISKNKIDEFVSNKDKTNFTAANNQININSLKLKNDYNFSNKENIPSYINNVINSNLNKETDLANKETNIVNHISKEYSIKKEKINISNSKSNEITAMNNSKNPSYNFSFHRHNQIKFPTEQNFNEQNSNANSVNVNLQHEFKQINNDIINIHQPPTDLKKEGDKETKSDVTIYDFKEYHKKNYNFDNNSLNPTNFTGVNIHNKEENSVLEVKNQNNISRFSMGNISNDNIRSERKIIKKPNFKIKDKQASNRMSVNRQSLVDAFMEIDNKAKNNEQFEIKEDEEEFNERYRSTQTKLQNNDKDDCELLSNIKLTSPNRLNNNIINDNDLENLYQKQDFDQDQDLQQNGKENISAPNQISNSAQDNFDNNTKRGFITKKHFYSINDLEANKNTEPNNTESYITSLIDSDIAEYSLEKIELLKKRINEKEKQIEKYEIISNNLDNTIKEIIRSNYEKINLIQDLHKQSITSKYKEKVIGSILEFINLKFEREPEYLKIIFRNQIYLYLFVSENQSQITIYKIYVSSKLKQFEIFPTNDIKKQSSINNLFSELINRLTDNILNPILNRPIELNQFFKIYISMLLRLYGQTIFVHEFCITYLNQFCELIEIQNLGINSESNFNHNYGSNNFEFSFNFVYCFQTKSNVMIKFWLNFKINTQNEDDDKLIEFKYIGFDYISKNEVGNQNQNSLNSKIVELFKKLDDEIEKSFNNMSSVFYVICLFFDLLRNKIK